nr:hypothetical protein [Tanacetum cinerariifolium]
MKRGYSGEHTPLFPSMLKIQAEEGEGSRYPSEPQPPPSTTQLTNEETIPNVVSSSYQKPQTPRKALNKVTELPQTSEPIPNVADVAIYEEWDDRVGIGAGGSPRCQEAMGVSLLKLGNVQQQSNNPPLSRGHTLGNGEDSIELIKKLIETCTKPSERVLALEESKTAHDLVITRLKLRVKKLMRRILPQPMIEEIDQDARVTLVQIDVEDQWRFDDETNFDASFYKTYTRRRRVVSTGSGGTSTASRLFCTVEKSVGTVGASMPVSTAGMVQEVNINIPSPVVVKDKGKGKMEESKDERTKRTRLQEQQDRLAQSFTEEEWENIRARVEADEELTQRLQAEERNKYSEVDQINELFETTMKRVNTFVPMETEVKGRASELAARSLQVIITNSSKVGSFKLAAEVELDYKGYKRQKTNEASGDDLVMLWSLVKERFSATEPDDKERTLWVELKRERISNVKKGSDFDMGSGILWKLILLFLDLRVTVPLSNLIMTLAVVRNGAPKIKGLFRLPLCLKPQSPRVITEYLVNISKRRAFWSLNEDILKITILTTNTPYLSRKIQQFAADGAVNLALKMKGDMIIKNLNLKPTTDAMMMGFLEVLKSFSVERIEKGNG